MNLIKVRNFHVLLDVLENLNEDVAMEIPKMID